MNEIVKQETMTVQDAQNIRTLDGIAAEINYITQKTKETVLSGAIEIGRRLCEAKELVLHGQWEQWLHDNVNYSQSTANNLMAVYREYGSDQQSLFAKASSKAIEDLTYSKAVALLVLPKEQREEFIEANPVEDMSTRQLQEAIKRAQKAEEDLDTAIEQRQKYQKQAGDEMARANKLTAENHDLQTQVKKMEERLASAKKAAEEWEKTREAQKKAEAKADKLTAKIKKLEEKQNQPDQQTLDRLAEEAAAKAKEESKQELEALKEQLAAAQQEKEQIAKRLATSGSEEMQQAKLLIANIQSDYNRMIGLAMSLKNKGDDESALKIKTVAKNLLAKCTENVEALPW